MLERDGVAAEVLAAYDASLDALARLGAEIVSVELPRRFAGFTDLTGRIIGAEGYFSGRPSGRRHDVADR